jgi:lipopolysaccharide export LptBFGC system permease protein LptF
VIRGGSPRTFDVLNRKWIVSRGGDIYHYLFFDPATSELNGLSIFHLDQKAWRLSSRTFAAKAAFASGWRASDGWIRTFRSDGQNAYSAFKASELALEPPDYFLTEQPDAERMTYPQLARYVDELRSSGFNVVPQLVALHRKLSFPFVTIIMTLIAVPFAVTTGSRGALYGVGAGLVLAIIYWILISVFAAIGSAGMISPPLAAWTPNVLFLLGAGYLLLSART